MSLEQQAAISQIGEFRDRVLMGAVGVAHQVAGEDAGGRGKQELAKRAELATRILVGDNVLMHAIVRSVASQVGDTDDHTSITDEDITSALAAVLPDIAGVTAADRA
jgi:hypothetical protein